MADLPASSPSLPTHERVRLMRDGLIQNSSVVAASLAGVVLVPLLLHGLGDAPYGLWVSSLAVAGVAGGIDLGLAVSIMREVAAADGQPPPAETVRFVVSCAKLAVLVGLVGAVAIAVAGLAMLPGLRLDPELRAQAPWVFALTGLGFCADHLVGWSTAVLGGLRRFGTTNLLSLGTVVLRTAGMFVLVSGLHAGVVAVAGWHAAISAILALASTRAVTRREPAYRPFAALFDWPAVRARVRYALTGQITNLVGRGIWQAPPILIGIFRGSPAVAGFFVAQRLPFMLYGTLWRVVEVMFPTASAGAAEPTILRDVLNVGARWVLVLALPCCVVLWILGPEILRTWLGAAPESAGTLMSLGCGTVLAEALCFPAEVMMLAAGFGRALVIVLVGRILLLIALCAGLLPAFGSVGAAVGQCAAATLGMLASVQVAGWHCGTSIVRVARHALAGLVPPLSACALIAYTADRLSLARGWIGLGSVSLAALASYAAVLAATSPREEERRLARELLAAPFRLARSVAARARRGR